MTQPPPVRRNSSSVAAGAIATSSIFSSASFSAAAWCSTERYAPDAPATQPRSAQCRSWRKSAVKSLGSSLRARQSINSSVDSKRLASTTRRFTRRPNRGANLALSSTAGLKTPPSALAYATVAAISVIDFEAIVIEGALPATVRERLTARTAQVFASLDRRGLSEVDIVSGSIGADAGSIGAAALPLIKQFARDREVLFKDAMRQAS